MTDIPEDELEWADIGAVDEWEEGKARLVEIGKRRIGVYRMEDGWRAIKDLCPHAGAPLHQGMVVNGAVLCPLHGWAFDLKTGEGPGCDVATYPVKIDGDRVLVGY